MNIFEGLGTAYVVGVLAAVGLITIGWVAFIYIQPWKSKRRVATVCARFFLTLWVFMSISATLEVCFVLFYDTTDSYGLLKSSELWYRRHARHNRAGFRDSKEFTLEIPPGKQRIWIVGDSFAFGHGIAHVKDRFGDRINSLLQKNFPNKFELYNMALPGTGTGHQLNLLQRWDAKHVETDAIVLVYVLNDLEDLLPQSKTMAKNIPTRPSLWLFRHSYLFNFLYHRFQPDRSERTDYFSWLDNAYEGEVWEAQKQRLDALCLWCKIRAIDLRVIVFPFLDNLKDYQFRDAHQTVSNYFRAQEVQVLDLLETMEAHNDDVLVVNSFDAHPNERAHELAAKAIWKPMVLDLVEDMSSEE